jgi:hypothetical protein
VPKTTSGKISLARDIHCCPIFFSFAQPASLNCKENVCVYISICECVQIVCVYISLCECVQIVCVYISICECLQIVYGLPLLPNNTAAKPFYTNQERCEVLNGYLSSGRRPGGDWANMWHWTERFAVFFWNRK